MMRVMGLELGLEIVADPPTTMPPVGPALQASDPQSRSAVVDISRMREARCHVGFLAASAHDEEETPVVPGSLDRPVGREIGRQGSVTRERRLQTDAKSA